jgi:hypothetical protein
MNTHGNAALKLADAPEGEKKMKGIGFANVKKYVEAKHGHGKWLEVLASMGKEDAHIIDSFVAVGWYDVMLFAHLLRAIDRVCGANDLKLMDAIGKFEAEQDFSRVLRVFLRVLAPQHIFRAEARLWSHFQDTGTWTSVKVPGGMNAMLNGWAVDRALCTELAGYLVRLVQFTGGTDVTVRHAECRALGHPFCLFEYRYK